MRRYTVLLLPDLEGNGYTVTVPLLPGCITEGDTIDEALAMAREAVELYLEVLGDEGRPIPEEPVPPELMAAALATADEIQRQCAADLRADGVPVPDSLPVPFERVVEVQDVEIAR